MLLGNSQYALGLVAVLTTAAIWTSGNIIIQFIGASSSSSATLPPFVITYLTLAPFVLYFPIFAFQVRKEQKDDALARRSSSSRHHGNEGLPDKLKMPLMSRVSHCTHYGPGSTEEPNTDPSKAEKTDGTNANNKLSSTETTNDTTETNDTTHTGPCVRSGTWPGAIQDTTIFINHWTENQQTEDHEEWLIPAASVRESRDVHIEVFEMVAGHSTAARCRLPSSGFGSLLQHNYASMPLVGRILLQLQDQHIWTGAFVAFPVFFLTNFLCVMRLLYTSLASATIIYYATFPVFSHILSMLLLAQPFNRQRAVCEVLCIAGAVLVATADVQAGSGRNPVLGNVLSVLAALSFAVYSVILRKLFPGGMKGKSLSLFFAALGTTAAVTMLPGVTWYAAKGLVVGWPSGVVVGKALGNLLTEFTWGTSVLLLTPNVASSVISPLMSGFSISTDFLLHDPKWVKNMLPAILTSIGIFVIFTGYAGMSRSNRKARPAASQAAQRSCKA